MQRWAATLKTIAATAAVTSAAWLIGGAWWLQQERQRWEAHPAPVLQRAPVAHAPTPARAEDTVAEPSIAPVAPSETARLVIPVAGVRRGELVDTFTQARAGGRVHDAIDIMAPRGTPVLAAAPGQVEKLFLSKPGGLTIYVRSPDRTTIYYYAHLDGYTPGLAEGRQVRAGEQIATVGATGNANPAAPHLHFAVLRTSPEARWWDPSTAVNPYPLLTAR